MNKNRFMELCIKSLMLREENRIFKLLTCLSWAGVIATFAIEINYTKFRLQYNMHCMEYMVRFQFFKVKN